VKLGLTAEAQGRRKDLRVFNQTCPAQPSKKATWSPNLSAPIGPSAHREINHRGAEVLKENLRGRHTDLRHIRLSDGSMSFTLFTTGRAVTAEPMARSLFFVVQNFHYSSRSL
jgi:hypothetical protein